MFNDQELVGLVKAVARLSLALQQVETEVQIRDERIAQLMAENAELHGSPDQPQLEVVTE